MKADLHVHSYHSAYTTTLRFLGSRDSYSDPERIYDTAKRRGMDLVSITDHDSLDGCLEFLDRHPDSPDFIVGEEIECTFPDWRDHKGNPLKAHIGAWDLDERIHGEVQPLRDNAVELVAYLRQEDLPFAINHLFFYFHEQLTVEEYVAGMLSLFPAFETRNGAMLREQNELIMELLGARSAGSRALGQVAGSDAHTLTRIGLTYTEVPSTTRAQFLAGLKAGRGQVHGEHGTAWTLSRDIYTVILQYWSGLLGFRRDSLSWRRRLVGLGFSVPSLPFQFIPALVALSQKTRERDRIERYRRSLGRAPVPAAVVDPLAKNRAV